MSMLRGKPATLMDGRNSTHNDLTFHDISVIDYCLVPHEHLSHFQNFEVRKSIDLFEEAGCVGLVADPAHIMPDHNLLMWSLNLSPYLCMNPVRVQQTPSADFVKYDLTNIPPDCLMRPETV